MIDQVGWLTALIIPVIFACAFIVPSSLRQAVVRFRALGQQLTWWHVLWLLIFMSGFTFRVRDAQDIRNTAVDSWALYRITLVGVTALYLVIYVTVKRLPLLRSMFRGLIALLAIYALISVASTLWSVYPIWTLYRSTEYLVDVALLAAVLATVESETAYKTLLDWTWTFDGLLLASVWLGTIAWPSDALQSSNGLLSVQLNGVMPQISANGVGELSAIIAVVTSSRLLLRRSPRCGRAFYSLLLVLSLSTMLFAQTRSAILGFLSGFALVLYFSKRRVLVTLLIAGIILFVSLGQLGGLAEEYMRRGQSDEAVKSLSGRVEWWEAAWDVAKDHPWLGAGACTSRFTVLASQGYGDVSGIHNTYLETLVGVGVAGLLPIAAVLIASWKILWGLCWQHRWGSWPRHLAIEAIAVLAVITCRSFFTNSVVLHPSLESFAILGYAELLRRSIKQLPSYQTTAMRRGPAECGGASAGLKAYSRS